MKRKFLSILLTLAMALTLLPVSAMAEGDEVPAGGEPTPVEAPAVKTTTGDVTYSDNDAKIENLVYTSGTMTVTGANVTIENVTFGDGAALVVNTTGDFTLTNCIFAPTTKYVKDTAGIRTVAYLRVGGTATVTNNTFEGIDDGYYNAIEFGINDDPALKGANISGNTFKKTIQNNYFNFYNMAEGTVINITNNQFLLANKSSNGIRISNNKNVSATFNLDSNTYTYAATSEDSEYEGLILLQDYAGQNAVQDFKKIVINITNLTAPEDAKQILYVYDDQDGIIQTNQPVVKGDSSIEKFFVAKVGDTYYKTLPEAVAAAQNGETVTLLEDVTEDVTIPTDKTMTLDLNGKKLTNIDNNTITVENGATLTVTGTGTVDNVTHGKAAVYNKGTVTLAGGTYERSAEAGADANDDGGNSYYTVLNHGAMTVNAGVVVNNKGKYSSLFENGYYNYNNSDGVVNPTLTINGGTFDGGLNTIKNDDNAALTINGGTFQNYTQAAFQNHHIATVEGGTFIGRGSAKAVLQCGVCSTADEDHDKHQLTISGGYFFGEITKNVGTISITGGTFSSDPDAYVAAGHYVDASNNGDYPYTVKEGTKPAGALIVVKDKTDTAVNGNIADADKTAINNVIDKANVDGVAEAVAPAKKADIVSKSNANPGNNDKVEIEVAVKVEAKTADLANSKLTFEASPVATVKVNGTATDTTVPVTNDMLNGQPITVKLPLPTDFNPEQILHKFTGGGYEYFINEDEGSKRGAGSFKIEDGCAVFTIYGFSTFELSSTITYVEPSSGGGSSSSSRRYDVSAPSVKHGDVTVSPKTASKGDTVTITVKPDSGYELDTLTVKDASGSKIKVKDKGDGKFTFTMPASKVTVSAEFAEIETLDFADVSTDAYYYEAVKWAAKKGITGGTGDGTFNPNGSCTRAQSVTFLYRALGTAPTTVNGFTDVAADAFYADAVAWAVESGITLGTGDGTFSPNATCTRAQSVTFLYRALGTAPTTVNGFTDVAADAFYADAVAWAVESGVTNGTTDSTFSPNNGCTRAQIVTFLYRAY